MYNIIMKWQHPLKGRTIKMAMADALDMASTNGTIFDENRFWRNSGVDIAYNGVASWGYTYYNPTKNPIHSWDSMKDCLKYGFTIDPDGCVIAIDKDILHSSLDIR